MSMPYGDNTQLMLASLHQQGKVFTFERLPDMEAVRKQIKTCEGKHVQQAIFSTFMDTLTQVCFTCQRVRSTIEWAGSTSWVPE